MARPAIEDFAWKDKANGIHTCEEKVVNLKIKAVWAKIALKLDFKQQAATRIQSLRNKSGCGAAEVKRLLTEKEWSAYKTQKEKKKKKKKKEEKKEKKGKRGRRSQATQAPPRPKKTNLWQFFQGPEGAAYSCKLKGKQYAILRMSQAFLADIKKMGEQKVLSTQNLQELKAKAEATWFTESWLQKTWRFIAKYGSHLASWGVLTAIFDIVLLSAVPTLAPALALGISAITGLVVLGCLAQKLGNWLGDKMYDWCRARGEAAQIIEQRVDDFVDIAKIYCKGQNLFNRYLDNQVTKEAALAAVARSNPGLSPSTSRSRSRQGPRGSVSAVSGNGGENENSQISLLVNGSPVVDSRRSSGVNHRQTSQSSRGSSRRGSAKVSGGESEEHSQVGLLGQGSSSGGSRRSSGKGGNMQGLIGKDNTDGGGRRRKQQKKRR